MRGIGFPAADLTDARIAAHALSPMPVWLWSADAPRILWANPTAAAIFNIGAPADAPVFNSMQTAAAQITRLAHTLPQNGAARLERLRGFGAGVGRPLTCLCSRLTLEDDSTAILVAAAERAGPDFPLAERARRLLADRTDAAAIFAIDGTLIEATPAARERLGETQELAELGAQALAQEASVSGKAEGDIGGTPARLLRLGAGHVTALLLEWDDRPQAAEHADADQPASPRQAAADAPALALPLRVVGSQPPESGAKSARQRFIWQTDSAGRFTADQSAFTALIGQKSAALLGQTWNDIVGALRLDGGEAVGKALESQNTWSGLMVRWPLDNGDRLPVDMSGLPVFDRDRRFAGYRGFGICRDVDRRAALPSRPVAEAITAKIESANVLSFPPIRPSEPILEPTEQSAFHELGRELSARLKKSAIKDDQVEEHFDPEPVPAPPPPPAAPRAPVRNDADAGEGRPIFDWLPLGVLVYRLNHLIYANSAFLEWTGYPTLSALAEAGGLDSLYIDMKHEPGTGNGKMPAGKPLIVSSPNSEQPPVEGRLFSIVWQGDNALLLMLQTGLAPAQSAPPPRPREDKTAPRATSSSSEFLANVSHAIRTPLNAIIGSSEVIVDERFGPLGDERYREYLKDIHGSGNRLIALLDDLLDLARIESGAADLSFAAVNLNDLVQQCVSMMQQDANHGRVIIRSSLNPGLPQIFADARSVRRIVLNLLTNSIKLTDAGGQVIVSTVLGDDAAVSLRVRDTGAAMSEAELQNRLDPFHRHAAAAPATLNGAGLGLPISKALAEANRARFRMTSEASGGTLVEVAFPANGMLAH